MFFRATGQAIGSSAANVLDITAGIVLNLQIGGSTEATLFVNQLAFNSGSSDTALDWSVDGQLKFLGVTTSMIFDDANNQLIFDAGATDVAIDWSTDGRFRIAAGAGMYDFTATLLTLPSDMKADGTIKLLEQADANADEAGYGQIWVNTATPNELFFTDDAGTDFQLGAASPGGSDTELQFNNAGSFGGLPLLTFDGTNFLLGTATTTKLQFRDSGIFIHSNSDGELTVEADSKVIIGVAGDIVLGDSTERVMKPQTDLKINLGDTSNRFNEAHIFELHVQQSVNNVSNPPTDAELDTAFGTPASLGRGFIGTIDDADADTIVWLCITTDVSWYFEQLTKAV